jgi:hypothetical protein
VISKTKKYEIENKTKTSLSKQGLKNLNGARRFKMETTG